MNARNISASHPKLPPPPLFFGGVGVDGGFEGGVTGGAVTLIAMLPELLAESVSFAACTDTVVVKVPATLVFKEMSK